MYHLFAVRQQQSDQKSIPKHGLLSFDNFLKYHFSSSKNWDHRQADQNSKNPKCHCDLKNIALQKTCSLVFAYNEFFVAKQPVSEHKLWLNEWDDVLKVERFELNEACELSRDDFEQRRQLEGQTQQVDHQLKSQEQVH